MNEYSLHLELEFDDFFEKKTQFALEMYIETKSVYQETNNARLYEAYTDLEIAINAANLSDIQRKDITMYYFKGYNQSDISSHRKVAQPTVHQSLRSSVIKIANVFREWEYWTEGESYIVR